jgi:hypothetical protein
MNDNDVLFSNKMPFQPSEIRMDSKVQSIYSLMKRVEHGEILTPSYQRKEVWGQQAKSRLIESILVRIPIPVFYIDATDENSWKIIDGLQRITAIKEFMLDKTLVLEGLEYIGDISGVTFDSLPRFYQRRIEETDITVIFINAGTPEPVKYNIFKRINTGGMPLSDQEIRHALNDGIATNKLNEISDESFISDLWRDTNERMELNELVLRGLGYWFINFKDVLPLTIDEYLNLAMKKINSSELDVVEKKIKEFTFAYHFCTSLFGLEVFRKPSNDRLNSPNKNIFETWMAVLSQMSNDEILGLEENKVEIKTKFYKLFDTKTYSNYFNSRKTNSIKNRVLALKEIVLGKSK